MSFIKGQIWLGGVVGYHVSLTRHSPSDTEGPEFKPRLSHAMRRRVLFALFVVVAVVLELELGVVELRDAHERPNVGFYQSGGAGTSFNVCENIEIILP